MVVEVDSLLKNEAKHEIIFLNEQGSFIILWTTRLLEKILVKFQNQTKSEIIVQHHILVSGDISYPLPLAEELS